MNRFKTISPIDGSIILERDYDSDAGIAAALERARSAVNEWRRIKLEDRIRLLHAALDVFEKRADEFGGQLTHQMGRPIRFAARELHTMVERGRTMLRIAKDALRPYVPESVDGFDRYVVREPIGVVAVLAPWNYPYLTAVNSVIPALAAGNAVLLKHSQQTPLCADNFSNAFEAAGLPEGVFTSLFLTHEQVAEMLHTDSVDFVCFTGSVTGGQAIQAALAQRFVAAGLELGGKDPAYVRADAEIVAAAESLMDGAFFNSGQSCCGVERIYVHESVFNPFIEACIEEGRKLVLGDPRDASVTLGPMINMKAANFVRNQIDAALAAGATELLPRLDNDQDNYLSPQILIDVDHSMSLMREESFGPVVGVMPVTDDAAAIDLMNDSDYGLTASIWTADTSAAKELGAELETGTVFMNRCDFVDPGLAWTGVKNSGRGCTLSALGFEQLTQAKSYHLKI